MEYIYCDTETTGLDPEDRLCQLAAKFSHDGFVINELFKPPVPIKIDAMAVNHITEKMVEEEPAFRGSPEFTMLQNRLSQEGAVFVAHNAPFDIGMLVREGMVVPTFVCTKKLAMALDPAGKIGRYNLQYLRYKFKMEIEATAHDALGDVLVLERLFEIELEAYQKKYNVDEAAAVVMMVEQSLAPVLLPIMPFGKHRGAKFAAVPLDYLRWLSRQPDLDEDLRYSVTYYIRKAMEPVKA